MVFAVGETVCEPEATGVTAPIPWLIENEVAFDVVHESDDEDPFSIVAGLAVRVQVGADGGGAQEGLVPMYL